MPTWPWEKAATEAPPMPNRAERRAREQRRRAQQRKGQRAYNRSRRERKTDE